MGKLFDQLAKDSAADMPRRQVFRTVGGGLLGIVLAAVGLAAKSDCGKLCAACCSNLDFPPRGQEHAQCIKDCHEGLGPCGPLVCPQ